MKLRCRFCNKILTEDETYRCGVTHLDLHFHDMHQLIKKMKIHRENLVSQTDKDVSQVDKELAQAALRLGYLVEIKDMEDDKWIIVED